jgi:hypothetical protein
MTMSVTRILFGAALVTALVLPASASAQRAGEVTFYSGPAFSGQSYTVTGPREHVRVPFRVRSARVAPGETWEVCTADEYRGDCITVTQSQLLAAWTVNSVRPSNVTTLPAPVTPGPAQSLRGMAAEFFPQPSDASGRVISCTSGAASCAAASADRFCQTRGWTAAAYQSQETVSGRNYLADVLCTRTR